MIQAFSPAMSKHDMKSGLNVLNAGLLDSSRYWKKSLLSPHFYFILAVNNIAFPQADTCIQAT